MGRGYKGLDTWEQICLIWFMMIIWGGLLFLFIWTIVTIYKLIIGN